MDHIDRHIFETYLLNPKSVSREESVKINEHLTECRLCAEEYRRLQEFYIALEDKLKQQPALRDKEIAERLTDDKHHTLPEQGLELRRRKDSVGEMLDSRAEVIVPSKRSGAHKVVTYMRMYPMRTATFSALGAAAIALFVLTTRPSRDSNPTFVAVQKAVLTTYNKEGEALWTKSAAGIPDLRSDEQPDVGTIGKRCLSIADFDGNGVNEVLVSGPDYGGDFSPDTLYCFDQNGSLRWKAGVGQMISFGKQGQAQHSTNFIVDWLVVKRRPEDRDQLFVISHDRIFSPAKLAEIDVKTGIEKQSYFNRGHCAILRSADVDSDGVNELLVAGENDGYNKACIAILDPSRVRGFGPVPDHYQPVDNGMKGSEKYYILFPKTDLGDLVRRAPFNHVREIVITQRGNLIVHINESTGSAELGDQGSVLYTFDHSMNIESVALGDPFRVAYNRYVKEGKLKQPLTPAYTENLKNSILYWDGEKFVNIPASNKRSLNGTDPLP